VRTQAALILVAELLCFIFDLISQRTKFRTALKNTRSHPSLSVIGGTMALYLLVNNIILHAPAGTMAFYGQLFNVKDRGTIELLGHNLNYVIDQLYAVMHFESYDNWSKVIIKVTESSSLIFMLIGLVTVMRKKLEVYTLFYLLVFVMMLLLPVYQGLRYMLPIVPFFLLYMYHGLKVCFTQVISTTYLKGTIIVGTILYLSAGATHISKLSDPPDWNMYTTQDSVAFDYLSKNIEDHEIIAFAKPRALSLYTGKRCINLPWQIAPALIRHHFDSLHVKYLVSRSETEDNIAVNYLSQTGGALDTIRISGNYTLYTIAR
jgi:hypothetical protein